MHTFHIHINGIVQGVGFRPKIYQMATTMHLNGTVENGADGLHIFFNASKEVAVMFFKKVKQEAPPQARIISAVMKVNEDDIAYTDFTIIMEEEETNRKVLIAPDKAICPECRKELHDPSSRRYRYPFITCTQCGPRYSIIKDLPFERHNTSMHCFTMCPVCKDEYANVEDRRFYSQTNSCPNCGIGLTLRDKTSAVLCSETPKVLDGIRYFLREGKILAVKGIGGYLLICSAGNSATIDLLRKRKKRSAKPFALLYPDMESVLAHFEVNEEEKTFLESEEAPIVLLVPKPQAFKTIAFSSIAPGLNRLGVMLPSNPLLDLIATDFGMPLIATSANLSGSPLIYRDEDALAFLFDIADLVVSNNREIIIPQDDSVVQVTPAFRQPILLRRSRGYAPSIVKYRSQSKRRLLSTGAFLKSSFTLTVNRNVFVSQYLGSGETYESQQMYKETLAHWLKLYGVKPDSVIADRHPGYFTHQYSLQLEEPFQVYVDFIQHHEAHLSAILAEYGLIHCPEPILGVIWDGTGLGGDGNTWGGEFFYYDKKEIQRISHFDYFPVIAGDKMALEPRLAAFCLLSDSCPQSPFFTETVRKKFTKTEWNNYDSLVQTTPHFTSSVGRIFDALASMLGICDIQTYEGEAAMRVQGLAEAYVAEHGFVMDRSYFPDDFRRGYVPTPVLIQEIVKDIIAGKDKKYIAARFHFSLAEFIGRMAVHKGVFRICFSGGVFQNALLVDWINHVHKKRYQLFFHKDFAPNDENISFGQMVFCDKNLISDNRIYPEEIHPEDYMDDTPPEYPGGIELIWEKKNHS
ncbi:carbamoyltransferase HypF [Flavitalea flava]